MLNRYLLATLAGGVVLMIWGAVWWALSPLGFYVMHAAPDEEVVSLLSDSLREKGHGVYFYPYTAADDEAAVEAFYEKHRRGPLVQIFYHPEGADPMSTKVFVGGFVHALAAAALVGAMLLMTLPSLPTYGRRVLLVLLAGTFAGVVVELSRPIWFYHAWGFALFGALFQVTAWLLAGLAMAAILKPHGLVVANAHRPAG